MIYFELLEIHILCLFSFTLFLFLGCRYKNDAIFSLDNTHDVCLFYNSHSGNDIFIAKNNVSSV